MVDPGRLLRLVIHIYEHASVPLVARDVAQAVTLCKHLTVALDASAPFDFKVTALFSTAGVMTASYLYSPYGDTTIHSEVGGAGTDNPFRYISGWQDTGTNKFYKLGARYYDGHGHFTQADPLAGSISDPRTITAYNYAGADPVNQGDENGEAFCYPGFKPFRFLPNDRKSPYCQPRREFLFKGDASAGIGFILENMWGCATGGLIGVASKSATVYLLALGANLGKLAAAAAGPPGWLVFGAACAGYVWFTNNVH